ncbi:phospholipase D family protein [Komagataeibacter oboediens]
MFMNKEFSYFSGEMLRNVIRYVMQGNKPRMCVAFLGPNWTHELFGAAPPQGLKVICDLSMGATTRSALEEFGAPKNEKLRFLDNTQLHGKIYISESGAIVCSANATYSGLSREDRIEDGVFIPANSSVFDNVAKEFEQRYADSRKVTQAKLDEAAVYLPYTEEKAGSSQVATSFPNLILRNTSAFRGVGFTFSQRDVSKKVKDSAYSQYQSRDEAVESITSKSLDYFANWDTAEADWPALLISVYRTPSRIILSKRSFIAFIKDAHGEEVFITRKVDWRVAGVAFGDCPALGKKATSETELFDLIGKEEIFNDLDGRILSASEFAAFLSEHVSFK